MIASRQAENKATTLAKLGIADRGFNLTLAEQSVANITDLRFRGDNLALALVATNILVWEKPITCYYVGDFDPSGFDLERDVREKISRYCQRDFEWERLQSIESLEREQFNKVMGQLSVHSGGDS